MKYFHITIEVILDYYHRVIYIVAQDKLTNIHIRILFLGFSTNQNRLHVIPC